MPAISPWAEAVPMSGVREIFHLIAGRHDIHHLEIGQPDFPTPDHVIEAAAASARAGSGYTNSPGTPSLREAIADKSRRVDGFDVTADQIIVSQGGIQGVSAVMSTLVRPGGEVMLPDPGWPNFEMLALLHGAKPVRYRLAPERGFLPDPEELASLINANTQLLIMNTPSNPTGSLFPDALVDEFIALARQHDVPLLADEVYDELIFDGKEPARAFARDPEQVIGLYSFSKTYSMTGWRVGWVVAPEWLAPTLARIQEPLISCLPTMTQAAAEAAITGPQEIVATMRDSYQHRRDLAVEALAAGGIEVVPPAGGFYLMVPLAEGVDSKAAAFDLIDRNVAVSPGTAYGAVSASHLRISLAASEHDLVHGIAIINEWYAETAGGTKVGS